MHDKLNWDFFFSSVWADNADAVSTTYSGTGALKTDFTRTGQRTKSGALQDLTNSITRYVKNNFMDGYRQDAFDLFLGNYVVVAKADSTSSPFVENKPLRVRVVPYILLFALFMLFLNLICPGYSSAQQSWLSYLLLLVFWLSVLISGVRFALRHSNQFVTRPHLVPQTDYDHVDFNEGVSEKGSFAPPEMGVPPAKIE